MKNSNQSIKKLIFKILLIALFQTSFSQTPEKDLIIGIWEPEGSSGYIKVFEVNGVCNFFKGSDLLESYQWSIPEEGLLQLVDIKTNEIYKYELSFYPDNKIMDLIFFPLPSKSMLYYRVFGNTPQSRAYTKNDCGAFGIGSTTTITIPAANYVSHDSQADADAQAIAYLNWYPQYEINKLGTCTYSYPNNEKSGYFTKNNCTSLGAIGSRVSYVVKSGQYKSPISIAEADALAQADINANGQAYANSNGSCYFMSKALTNAPFRKVCVAPKVGTIVYYSAPAGLFISYISQADADAKVQKAGQDNANSKGYCN